MLSEGDPGYDFLMELFERHPNRDEKLRKPIKSIIIGQDIANKGSEVTLLYDDLLKDSISWVKCCNSRDKTANHKYTEAKRREVAEQVIRFRMWKPREDNCAKCGSLQTALEVDHVIPFSNLLTTWETHHSKTWKWPEFHKAHAELQLLCVPCHRVKSST